MVVLPTVFSDDVRAGPHEVIMSPVKRAVVGVSLGPAGTGPLLHRRGDTGGKPTLHLTHLIGTAGDTAAGQRAAS